MAAGEHSLSSYNMGSLAILGCSEITQTFWMVETSHALRLGTQHSGAGRCQPPAFGVRWLQDVQSVRGAPSASPIKFAEALQCLRCSAFRWWWEVVSSWTSQGNLVFISRWVRSAVWSSSGCAWQTPPWFHNYPSDQQMELREYYFLKGNKISSLWLSP